MLQEIQYEDDLPVKVQVLQIQQYPWHVHNDIQIVYVLEGEVELKMTYARYRLTKNNVHFIHSDDVHGFRTLSNNNLVVVLSLNMDYFSKYYPHLDVQVFTTKVSENIATYKKQLALKVHMFSIISELHGKKKGYKDRIKEISHALIDALYKDFRGFTVNLESRTFEHQISHDLVQIDRISRVVGFVYMNYPYKLSLSSIAESENINSYYLSHLFQRLVGDSFRNFVSMVRVEMSEPELLTTDNSIAQVSSNVGFSNAKYYVENFKEWFGCHPKEYRQLYRSETIRQSTCLVKELPLDSINDAIESYGEIPAFTGAAQQIKSVSFDLKKASLLYRLVPDDELPKKFYRNYNPQQDCINFLKTVLKDPEAKNMPQAFIDTAVNRNGIFTFNNIKKPLYYLRRFLFAQYNTVGGHDKWYMITVNDSNVQILFFNEDAENPQNLEFDLFNMPGKYQITEHRLRADSNCLDLWRQMEYKSDLTENEKQQIQEMSAPRILWKTVSSSGSFTYSAKLDPLDIVFTEIKKTQ